MVDKRMVHIIDDDASVRRSLEHLLRAAGFNTAQYASPFAALASAADLSSGCILLDIRMPGMDGLELHRRLTEAGVYLPVVVMTGQGDVTTAVKAMKGGAIDFIEKPFDDERLLDVLEDALALDRLSDRRRSAIDAARRLATLSPRERQVLDAVVAGAASKTIANDLGISVRTVEVHRARMLERLGTRSIAEAVRLSVLASLD